MSEYKDLNIFEKMLKIQTEMKTIGKNLKVITNPDKGTGYKAVSEKDVKDAVKPLEAKYGIYSYPVNTEKDESGIFEDAKGRRYMQIRTKVTCRFVNIDKPEEYIEVSAYGEGLDSSDKAPGKADTYAVKYCLMKAYKISTGAEEGESKSKGNEQPKNQTVQKMATSNQIYRINQMWNNDVQAILDYYKIDSLEKLTMAQASQIISSGGLE